MTQIQTSLPKKAKLLTREEERQLIADWQNDRSFEARDKILSYFDKACRMFAREIAIEQRTPHLKEDMVQQSFELMLTAIDDFDLCSENGLFVFARTTIHAGLRKMALELRGPTRIGTNSGDKTVIYKWLKAREEFRNIHGRDADAYDNAEIARLIGVDKHIVDRMMPRLMPRDKSLDEKYPERWMHQTVDEIEDEDCHEFDQVKRSLPIAYVLASEDPDPEEKIASEQIARHLHSAIGAIDPVSMKCAGRTLLLDKSLSRNKVAKTLGLCRKKVGQIGHAAVDQVRQSMIAADIRVSDAAAC